MSEKKYPIVEIFDSLQGEGLYTNCQMTFVRLAGCNVGVYPSQVRGRTPEDFSVAHPNFPKLELADDVVPAGHSICETVFGDKFVCDTQYKMTDKMGVYEIASRCRKAERVCLTGGEPFLHDLGPLVEVLPGKKIHIETSGTKLFATDDFARLGIRNWIYVACSPKKGYLPANSPVINEFKFVVKGGSPAASTAARIACFCNENCIPADKVYLQPFNLVHSVNADNLRYAQEVAKYNPSWKLSVQLHKFIGIR